MRIFVTGASGFVGSAVVDELIANGHQVTGLARSDDSAAKVEQAGATVLRGELTDLDSLRRGVESADAVIHTAFVHDFSKFEESCAIDAAAINAMAEVLRGSEKPMLVTGGTALEKSGRLGLESDKPIAGFPRQSDKLALELAAEGLRVSSLRLPQVHGDGMRFGFINMFIDVARQSGKSAYIGDGGNCWCSVHRADAARVYRLAIERGAEGGPFHAVAEEAIPTKTLAELFGRKLGVPVVSISAEEAQAHFGWLATFIQLDMATSSAHTRALLGWEPREEGVMADLETAKIWTA
ncbi:SDR family oxidoreductase [Stakelama sediminis]|uniref:Nucleoside-diphosphate-sugar epimerase n=1 Tax=Stakelama sediminis TaxID=463200 RepID=A0A840Z225_9SPHN|nr:nucleoside-diphosphate-sugar epimerase [Stakelama sediminis]